MATILCTETDAAHEYSDDTYDTMCQYDALTFKGRDQIATEA